MNRTLLAAFALVSLLAAVPAFADIVDAAYAAGLAAPQRISAPAETGAAAPVAPSVAITTFVLQQGNTHLAELCGKVTGGGSTTIVKLSIDPDTGKPATYYVLAGPDGLFCSAVVTYNGTADAAIAVGGKEIVSKPVSVSGDPGR